MVGVAQLTCMKQTIESVETRFKQKGLTARSVISACTQQEEACSNTEFTEALDELLFQLLTASLTVRFVLQMDDLTWQSLKYFSCDANVYYRCVAVLMFRSKRGRGRKLKLA